MTGFYRFAGRTVQVRSLYREVHDFCRDYRAEGTPAFTVVTVPGDIDFERKKSAREDRTAGRPVRAFPDWYLEELAVYRKIAERMPEYNTVLFHGSAIAVEGEGYLFTAKSGTGKSTHARLWRELLGERAVMVNDDKPLIRVTDAGAIVCGTPWDGKHRLSKNIAVPLRAICVLERAEKNRIQEMTISEVRPMLIQQTYRPANPAALAKTLTLLDKLTASVKLYRLGCNMEQEAAEVAYLTMRE